MSKDPQSNRRDFLSGKGALDAARANAQSVEINVPDELGFQRSLERQSNYVEQYSKNAMACEFEFFFNLHQYPQSGASVMKAFELIDQLEDQMTVYQSHSEVSQINQTAANETTKVEPRLFELLKQAEAIYQQTGNAFDITAGPLSRLWGFDKRRGAMPDGNSISDVLATVGMDQVKLDETDSTIQFLSPTTEINLNGIGKGYALDRVAELLKSKQIGDFMIHGGQSSVLAFGDSVSVPVSDQEDDADRLGWKVGVTHPTLPGVRLGEVTLRDQALGTSGTARQGFIHQGKRYGHIIDPRTGWPSGHILSTTVVTKSAAMSDALATAFFVMEISEVEQFCKQNSNVAAILIVAAPKAKGKVELVGLNLDAIGWKRVV